MIYLYLSQFIKCFHDISESVWYFALNFVILYINIISIYKQNKSPKHHFMHFPRILNVYHSKLQVKSVDFYKSSIADPSDGGCGGGCFGWRINNDIFILMFINKISNLCISFRSKVTKVLVYRLITVRQPRPCTGKHGLCYFLLFYCWPVPLPRLLHSYLYQISVVCR